MANPLSAQAAAGHVKDWLAAPAARLPDVTAATCSVLRWLLVDHEVTGILVPGALLAALAVQHGLPVVSADSDFARFTAATWVNPFA